MAVLFYFKNKKRIFEEYVEYYICKSFFQLDD